MKAVIKKQDSKDLEWLFENFGNVVLEFSEYSNSTVTYMKQLLNGDILIKKVTYGDAITGISFDRDSSKKLSEPEPYLFSIHYFPKSASLDECVEFFDL